MVKESIDFIENYIIWLKRDLMFHVYNVDWNTNVKAFTNFTFLFTNTQPYKLLKKLISMFAFTSVLLCMSKCHDRIRKA
jgi:hypothetical protein